MSTESNPHFEVTSGEEPLRPASPARERTLRHMRGLLAKAAFAGAALESAGCTPVVCDPLPPPITVDCNNLGSVDIAKAVSADARWAQGANGLTIAGSVRLSSQYSQSLAFTGVPVPQGATLDASAIAGNTLTFICTPAQGASTVKLAVTLKCGSSTTTTVNLTLDTSGTHQQGDSIAVTIGN